MSCALFSFLPAPDSTSGVISKTMEICLHKEGNSFGFVMRGRCIHLYNKGSNMITFK